MPDDSLTSPAAPAAPAGSSTAREQARAVRGARPRRTGILRGTAVVALVGTVAALAGLGVLLLPVETPLQDCGTSLTYLLRGRTDDYGDPASPPKGATKADVEANNAKPCHDRVVGHARPAVVLLLGGLVVAIFSGATELALRWRIHRRTFATQAARSARPPS